MLLVSVVFLILVNALTDTDSFRIPKWSRRNSVYPEEMGPGDDILFPAKSRSRRGVALSRPLTWEKNTIPYVISNGFSFPEQNKILQAMNLLQSYTCVKFQPRSPYDKDYVFFTEVGDNCRSSVGRIKGEQQIMLPSSCFVNMNNIIHEILHTVGLWHEHARPDRDNYVKIHYENIIPGREGNFDKLSYEQADTRIEYDYRSIMHYSTHAFSKNGFATIEAKIPGEIPRRRSLSQKDIQKVNLMYGCTDLDKNENIWYN